MNDSTSQPQFPQDLDSYAPWVAKHGLLRPYGECQCGCGQLAPIADWGRSLLGQAKGEPKRFVTGHNGIPSKANVNPEFDGYCKCGCGQKTRIAPINDANRGWVKGQHIEGYLYGHWAKTKSRIPPAERFWDKVDIKGADDCWNWTGGILGSGYGQFTLVDHKSTPAHRFAYELVKGNIPDGLFVCHACDNRRCCNPTHLWLGTNKDNMQDMVRKGRNAVRKGSDANTSKFTNEQVRQIRSDYADGKYTKKDLRSMYKVTKATIERMLSNKTYRDA